MNLFTNKLMVCQNCGDKEWGKADHSSQWNHLEMDGIGFYLCPKCWLRGIRTPEFTAWLAAKFPPKSVD